MVLTFAEPEFWIPDTFGYRTDNDVRDSSVTSAFRIDDAIEQSSVTSVVVRYGPRQMTREPKATSRSLLRMRRWFWPMLIGLETGDWRRRFGTSSTTRRYWVTGFGTGARKRQTDRASVFLWRTEASERRERFSEERNKFDAQMPTSQWTTKSTLLGLGLLVEAS
jgi:hypothetical protein